MGYVCKNAEVYSTGIRRRAGDDQLWMYFSSVFKKFNGVSPWEYITIKRVGRAIDMIKSTDMTKIEIAERCGFSSPSHFYKAFREITGKNPKDFAR